MTGTSILLKGGIVLVHDEHDHVKSLHNTDVLITGNRIAGVGTNIQAPRSTRTIDCHGKIVSPGFVDTHHHLWQTQLKGRHTDHDFISYFPTGNLQSYNYQPEDVFWGVLGGALESINAGTTTVLDHAHVTQTREHASQALRGDIVSGIRSIFAYGTVLRFDKWTQDEVVPQNDPIPEWSSQQLEEMAQNAPYADGRVNIGMGFDLLALGREKCVAVYKRALEAGVKMITTHVHKNAFLGTEFSHINTLKEWGLLKSPMILSHAITLTDQEYETATEADVYISSTPDIECQMGMLWPVALRPGIKAALGVDCHSTTTCSMLGQARTVLMTTRQKQNVELASRGKFPHLRSGGSERAFNLVTINGARALRMSDQIGSIKEGKLADLVIFDAATSPGMTCATEHDPMVAVLRHSDTHDIEMVMIDGKIRKEGGKLSPIQLEDGSVLEYSQVAQKLIESRNQIQQRVDQVSVDMAMKVLSQRFRRDITPIWEDVP